jgi:hypothetical protein
MHLALGPERRERWSPQQFFWNEVRRALLCTLASTPRICPIHSRVLPCEPKPRSLSGAIFLHTGNATGRKRDRHHHHDSSRDHESSRGTMPYNGARTSIISTSRNQNDSLAQLLMYQFAL